MNYKQIILALLGLTISVTVMAQMPPRQTGHCSVNINFSNDDVYLYENYRYNTRKDNRLFQLRKDPSGFHYIQLSTNNPQRKFFVSWRGQLIEVAPFGWRQVGACTFINGIPPRPNYTQNYRRLSMSNGYARGASNRLIPNQFVNQKQSFTPPLIASEQQAIACKNKALSHRGINKDQFGKCLVNSMLGKKEKKLYACSQQANSDETKMALCALGELGGQNERVAVRKISECYDEHKDNYDEYPMCLAEQEMNEDAAVVLGCIRKQSESGDVSFYGTAVCYGADQIDLNPEQQIILECGMASGGEPYSFASCAGGRLTSRELDKCMTHGIGGDNGCFGKNNDIIKGLKAMGIDLHEHYGPNHFVVKNWNNAVSDIKNGIGETNEINKMLSTAANDIKNGPGKNNDVVKAVERIIPGFKW